MKITTDEMRAICVEASQFWKQDVLDIMKSCKFKTTEDLVYDIRKLSRKDVIGLFEELIDNEIIEPICDDIYD